MDHELVLNPYGRILLYSKSSMTQILELYYNSEIKVHLINQCDQEKIPLLFKPHIKDNEKIITREAYLYTDDSTGRKKTVLYAISSIFTENLRSDVLDLLCRSNIPIGKLIEQYKLETFREIKSTGIVENHELPGNWNMNNNEKTVYKLYLIYNNNKPIFLIAEFFAFNDLVEVFIS